MDSKEFDGLSRQEASKFLSWKENEYKVLYPPPVKRLSGLDWKFKATIVTSTATILLAALRTSQMFYSAAETSARTWGLEGQFIQWMSVADAVVALVAVEAGLVVTSAIRTNHKRVVSDTVYVWQIAILLAISIVAGLGQSLGLVVNLDESVLQFFSYLLSLILGVGASFAAWFSGEVLGNLINLLNEQNEKAENEYQNEKEQYQKTARKFWNERKESEKKENAERKELERQKEMERISAERLSVPPVRSMYPDERTEKGEIRRTVRRTQNGNSEKQNILYSVLRKFRMEQNRTPGATELLEYLQANYPESGFASKGYISDLTKKWSMSNEVDTVSNSNGEKNE